MVDMATTVRAQLGRRDVHGVDVCVVGPVPDRQLDRPTITGLCAGAHGAGRRLVPVGMVGLDNPYQLGRSPTLPVMNPARAPFGNVDSSGTDPSGIDVTDPTVDRHIRPAGRVLILDPTDACLLAHVTTDDDMWLFTPGGGVITDEGALTAARREVAEETSIVVEETIGPVLHRCAHFRFQGRDIEARESFWVTHVDVRPPIVGSRLDDYEQELLGDWRWLTAGELRTSEIPVYPRCLPDLLDALTAPRAHSGAHLHPWLEEETAAGVSIVRHGLVPRWVAT